MADRIGNSAGAIKVSLALQEIAAELDQRLEGVAGQRVAFSLFVWTDGRANYVGNAPRPEIRKVLGDILKAWDAGLPDVPAHEVSG